MFKNFFSFILPLKKPAPPTLEIVGTLAEMSVRNKATAYKKLQETSSEIRQQFSHNVENFKKIVRRKMSEGGYLPLSLWLYSPDIKAEEFAFIAAEEIENLKRWGETEGLEVTGPYDDSLGTLSFRFDVAKDNNV